MLVVVVKIRRSAKVQSTRGTLFCVPVPTIPVLKSSQSNTWRGRIYGVRRMRDASSMEQFSTSRYLKNFHCTYIIR